MADSDIIVIWHLVVLFISMVKPVFFRIFYSANSLAYLTSEEECLI
jgi:hypothetical protein